MDHLNGFGKSADMFRDNLGEYALHEDGHPIFKFKDMTPMQVLKWNWEYPEFKINLVTRRMKTPIFIKRNGKKKR